MLDACEVLAMDPSLFQTPIKDRNAFNVPIIRAARQKGSPGAGGARSVVG